MTIKLRKPLSWLSVVAAAAMALQPLNAKIITLKLEYATFEDLQKAMDAGAITSVELMTLYLNRRAVYDQAGVRLNSVVSISPTLMSDAAASDTRRAANSLLGPIDGIPFATKDSYNTMGMATTGGYTAWLDMIAQGDCFIVSKLRQAGAVLLGHANMDRFASSATNTVSDFGATLNAYTLGVPGGSSGGPGVVAGGNFAGFGFGGETGGSIKNPSDRAGAVGFKVGGGTISVQNILALAPDRDVIGPITRYAKDNAAIMEVAVAENPSDIWATVNYVPERPKASGFLGKLATATLAGKKIGVVGTYAGISLPNPGPTPIAVEGLPTNTGTSANTTQTTAIGAEFNTILSRARDELTALGAEVVTVFLPPNVDTAVNLGTGMPTRALAVAPNTTNLQSLAHYTFFTGQFGPANDPIVRLTQASRAAALITAVANQNFVAFTDPAGVEHWSAQAIINKRFEAWMDSQGLDVLVWPTHSNKTRTTATIPGRDLANNLDLPLVTMPMGIIPSTGEPTTLAFLGKWHTEADILALAHAFEKGTNYRMPSTLAPPLDGETIVYDDASVVTPIGSLTNVETPIPPALRPETLAPVVQIDGTAEVTGEDETARLIVRGVAADASGVRSVKVYVNGRKIPSTQAKRWTAKLSISELKKVMKSKGKKVEVVVMAKDKYGNASATRKNVKIPSLTF